MSDSDPLASSLHSSDHVSSVTPSATTPPSPASRCHLDHFAPALSCLSTAELLASRRVCRGWLAASERVAAWPTEAESFASLLSRVKLAIYREFVINLDWNPVSAESLLGGSFAQNRSLSIYVCEDGAPSSSGHRSIRLAQVTHIVEAPQWRLARECFVQSHETQSDSSGRLLREVAKLPHLTSLHIDSVHPNLIDAIALFSTLAPRLLGFKAERCFFRWIRSRPIAGAIGRLTNLRVLLQLDDSISPAGLLQLHSLEILRMTDLKSLPEETNAVLSAARTLSVKHRLRHLCVRLNASIELTALSAPTADVFPSAALHTLSLHCRVLSVASHTAILSLPALTALTLSGWRSPIASWLESGADRLAGGSTLLELNVNQQNLPGPMLQMLAERCPMLQRIALESVNDTPDSPLAPFVHLQAHGPAHSEPDACFVPSVSLSLARAQVDLGCRPSAPVDCATPVDRRLSIMDRPGMGSQWPGVHAGQNGAAPVTPTLSARALQTKFAG